MKACLGRLLGPLLPASLLLLCAPSLPAQLSGTRNIPGDYPTLGAAIADLNAQGVGAGGVTLNLVAGNPQTAPPGGFVLTATGTAANPVTLTGNGNTITAGSQVSGSVFDAVFALVGSDYVTLQGFNIVENPANLIVNVGTNTVTEFGFLLVHASATNGCQNNTIQNNTVSLRQNYVHSFGIFSTSASSPTNTTLDATSSAGTNSNNRIYANQISNVAQGILFIAPPATASVAETGNDVGGSSLATGNTISFGNDLNNNTTPWARTTSLGQSGINFRNGVGNTARFNNVTSANVQYVGGGLFGIGGRNSTAATGVAYTTVYSDNQVTLNTTSATANGCVDFGHGLGGASGATLVAQRNILITNQSPPSVSVVNACGVRADYACTARTVTENQFTCNFTNVANSSGTVVGIGATGATQGTSLLEDNAIIINQNGNGGVNSVVTTAISGSATCTHNQ